MHIIPNLDVVKAIASSGKYKVVPLSCGIFIVILQHLLKP